MSRIGSSIGNSRARFKIGSGLWAGALGGTRTPNLLIRSQMLYPLSYERWFQQYMAADMLTVCVAGACWQHSGDRAGRRPASTTMSGAVRGYGHIG